MAFIATNQEMKGSQTRHQGTSFAFATRIIMAAFVAFALAFIALPVEAATIRYVIPGSLNVTDCDNPNLPCGVIGVAIAEADPGDEIRVGKGTYNLLLDINVNKSVTIIGGYDYNGPTGWSTSTYTVTPTILNGGNIRRPLQITANNVTIRNLTVQNGNATSSAQASHMGGGILISNSDDIVLHGLTLINNVASNSNTSSIGGAIAVFGAGELTIERTLIMSNTTPGNGGAIGVIASFGQIALINLRSSVLAHNSAQIGGAFSAAGGRVSLNTIHTTIAHNNVGDADEAIYMAGGSAMAGQTNQLSMNYSLLVGNNTAFRSATMQPVSIGASGVIMDEVTTDWDGAIGPVNPAVKRPLPFANPAAGDYHLVAGSPAIDIAGNTMRIDLDGRQRVNSANCTPFTLCPMGRSDDYGAYEYLYPAPVVRYVAPTGDDEINNCLNPVLPCKTPENVTKIVLGGDEIRLAQGTYMGGDFLCANSAVICIRQAITLTGGFTPANWNTPSTDPTLTVVDGTNIRQGIWVDYDVPDASALIRNLTVRNGNSVADGGGISIGNQMLGPAQNLTIRNCRVENSTATGDGDGGGIYANDPVNLTIENCVLTGNSATDGRGGGLAITDANGDATYTLTNLTVYGNMALRPDENSANGGRGGGIFLEGVGTLRQSEIYSNTANFTGGGISVGSNDANPTIDRVYIHDNQAPVGGGFSIFLTGGATLQNSLLVRNSAASTVPLKGQMTEIVGGNAIHTPEGGSPTKPLRVINVTIAHNDGAVPEAVKIEGFADLANTRINEFINVLIGGNEMGIRSDGLAVAALTKVLITNDVTTKLSGFEATRLTGTPLDGVAGFVGGGDYHLVPGADGVDDGDTVPGITQDLDGVNRPIGPGFDIGAYETTLQKQGQTITFDQIPNRALADSPFAVSPTASSGLPVTLTSLTPAICTVNGFDVTLVGEGSCSLQASQPGNATFDPAPNVTRNLDVAVVVPQMLMHMPALMKQ